MEIVAAVADLLQASQEAHRAALMLRQRRDPEYIPRLIQAQTLRLQALTEDPERTDPAWAMERASHDALMAFYEKHLTKQ